jgi:hypothetical protein
LVKLKSLKVYYFIVLFFFNVLKLILNFERNGSPIRCMFQLT